MIADLLVLGTAVTLIGALGLAVWLRRSHKDDAPPPLQPLTEEQEQEIRQRQWSEKLLEKVSKRGLRGRPIL